MRHKTLKNILAAKSFRLRLVGLMGKKKWPGRYDGLFFPDCASVHTFFTFLKPDLAFMDKNRKILQIVPKAGSWEIFLGPNGSAHCLELPSGQAERLGLKARDVVDFV